MIYFVTARELGRVKIGYSEGPRSRFIKARAFSPVPLELERICEGELADEGALHRRFAAHRAHAEWFTLCPEIEDHMATLPAMAVREVSLNKQIIAMGISPSHASMILSGTRKPARPLAIHIFRTTGWRHSVIAGLTDDDLAVFERVDPWKPLSTRPVPITDRAQADAA